LISPNTDGVAVILTILTMLSTPILTSIFGDGSLEGEDTEDWAQYEVAAEEEEEVALQTERLETLAASSNEVTIGAEVARCEKED